MKQLIQRSYQAIIKRKKITDNTHDFEFIEKLEEELREIKEAYNSGDKDHTIEEIVDMINVGINWLTHRNIDFIKEYEKVIIKNETRKD